MPTVDRVFRLSGDDAKPYTAALAELRIQIFREFPYLYDGDMAYEQWYIQSFIDSPGSVIVLAMDGEQVVGASTGLPLKDEDDAFKQPFVDAGIDPARVFYFGESVLLAAYRGQGVGHRFFDEREAHAASLDQAFDWLSFAIVLREPDDPRRPADYRPLDDFWRRRGFEPRPDLKTSFPWKEVGNAEKTHQSMTFWLKRV